MVNNILGGGISNIPNQLKGNNVLISTGYGTAATNQTENFKYDNHGNNTNYEEIYVVTTGKTFYVSSIIMGNGAAGSNTGQLATGAAAAEVNALSVVVPGDDTKIMNFNIPIKFTSATRLSWKLVAGSAGMYITLVGWEE